MLKLYKKQILKILCDCLLQLEILAKKQRLAQFLVDRKKRKEEAEIEKKEEIDCPDCGGELYKNGDSHIRLCLCYGQDRNTRIKIEKKEKTIKLKFPKSLDKENIELLLETLKQNK